MMGMGCGERRRGEPGGRARVHESLKVKNQRIECDSDGEYICPIPIRQSPLPQILKTYRATNLGQSSDQVIRHGSS